MRYLVVGGLGAVLHGAHYATRDLDILADTAPDNLEKLAQALQQLDARLRVAGLTDEESRLLPFVLDALTLREAATWTLSTSAGAVDVLTFLRDLNGAHIPFHGLRDAAVVVRTEVGPVLVASLRHIFEAKSCAGRPKDHALLPDLQRLLEHSETPQHNVRSLVEKRFQTALAGIDA